jgi:phosphatidate cytidylyltransferase
VGIPVSQPATQRLPVVVHAMLKQRLITVAFVLPLLLASLFLLPNAAWALVCIIPVVVGAAEWARLAGYGRTGRIGFTCAIACSCLGLALWMWRMPQASAVAQASTLLMMLALLFWSVVVPMWLYFRWRLTHFLALALAGWVVLVPAWLALAVLQKSAGLLLAVLVFIWLADTAAYFAGHRFGRNKLAPLISPGKTWEGVIGAFAAVILYAWLLSLLLQPEGNVFDRVSMMLFACVLTALGITGDLFESWIKRQAGAKDSGQLLPGHGGILDRVDSLTAALPFAALYFAMVA